MRVVLACGWPRPLGAVIHTGRLAHALGEAGTDIHAVAAHPARGRPVEGGILVLPVDIEEGHDPLDAARAAGAALTAASPLFTGVDVAHAQDAVSATTLIALRERGVVGSVVTTVHHIATHARGRLEDMQRHAIQESDAVVCASQWWADLILDEFGVEAHVVAHGVEGDRFTAPLLGRHAAGERFGWHDRPAVLSLGGVQPRKGSRVLLEAFARSRARLGARAILVVAGPAEHADYRARWADDAERLGLRVTRGGTAEPTTDVLEVGGVSADDMPGLYRACDVLVSPSTREGFGLSAIEAAASGIPNVVSDLPVFREHFSDGDTALFVPVGDTRELGVALMRALNDRELRGRLVTRGKALAAGFTWQRCAAEHRAVYAEVARAASSRA